MRIRIKSITAEIGLFQCFRLETVLNTFIYLDEGLDTLLDNEGGGEVFLDYAFGGMFEPQSDDAVSMSWYYPYNAGAPYGRYFKIDGHTIVGDSEQAPNCLWLILTMRLAGGRGQ